MTGQAVAEGLDQVIAQHGAPVSITVDHGTEFTSRALNEWAYQRGVKLDAFLVDRRCQWQRSKLGGTTTSIVGRTDLAVI